MIKVEPYPNLMRLRICVKIVKNLCRTQIMIQNIACKNLNLNLWDTRRSRLFNRRGPFLPHLQSIASNLSELLDRATLNLQCSHFTFSFYFPSLISRFSIAMNLKDPDQVHFLKTQCVKEKSVPRSALAF